MNLGDRTVNKRKYGSMTAAEFQTIVSQDPVYQAKVAAREARHREKRKIWAEAQKPLIAELAEAGVVVESVWDLISRVPKGTIPILLKHLQKPYSDKVREGIARALIIPAARVGWSTLVAEFERDPDTKALGAKAAIGFAIAKAAKDEDLEEVVGLIRDKRHGANRGTLLWALARSKLPLAEEVLNEMLDDEECCEEARVLLNRRIRNARRRQKKAKGKG